MILLCLDCGSVQEQEHRTGEDTCKACGSRRVTDYCEHPNAEWDGESGYKDGSGHYVQGECPDCGANLERMYSFTGVRDLDNDVVLTAQGDIP